MKHEMVDCEFDYTGRCWACTVCGKKSGPVLDSGWQRKCDGLHMSLESSVPSGFKLKEKTNVLIYPRRDRILFVMPHQMIFRFSRGVPVTWEYVSKRDLECTPVTDLETTTELNLALRTLRAEAEAKCEAANRKRKATIAAKKHAASA